MIIGLTLSRERFELDEATYGGGGGGGAGGEGIAVAGILVWKATCCSLVFIRFT
jgi:hypothetical protein